VRVSRRSLIAGASSAVALILVVGGVYLLTRGQPVSSAVPPTSQSPSPAPTPAKSHVLRSPFTGEPIPHRNVELIFKIDNVEQARPPTGLQQADLIYLLPVEGGLSRIMAVFSSHFPPVVGPVRSVRQEDIKLLRQFGRPALAYSGAQPHLLPHIEHARIVSLYAWTVRGYFRSASRVEPYNLYARTSQLVREARRASKARDIGFRFGPAPQGGEPMKVYRMSYPAAAFTFAWAARQHRYKVWMDGRPVYTARGGILGGRTIVVQYVRVSKSPFREWQGVEPPYANAVGHGPAVVLRDGRAYHVRWSRPRADGGTTYTLPDGHRMLFARGQVWVAFGVGKGSSTA
jgi:Protein of unknown function (DUF3048) N-terminal domain/Protein of unknown function (DUF3048) C-terminal domain